MEIYYLFIISISLFFTVLAVVLHADRLLLVTLFWGLINAFLFPLYLSYLQPLTSFLLYLFVFLAGGKAIYTVFHRRQKEENTVSTSQKNKQAPEETEQAKGGDVSKKINDIFPVKDPMVGDGEECLIGRDMVTPGDAIDACPVRPESNTLTDIAEQAGGEGVLCLPPRKPFPSLPLTTMEDRRKELASLLESDVTVDELVTLYLRCRRENNLLVSAEYLQAAFFRTDDPGIKILLCADLVIIYRELGRYLEAGEFVTSFLDEDGHLLETSTLEHFEKMMVYLQELDKLLRESGLSGVSYADLPETIKSRAGSIWKNNTIYL